MKCSDCQRDFPADLIHPFETGTTNLLTGIERAESMVPMCPICAYKRINKERGLPEGTKPPRTAPKARLIFERALQHVRNYPPK